MRNKVLSVFLTGIMFFSFLNLNFSLNVLAKEPLSNSVEKLSEGTSKKDLKIVGVIPARYESSRFPGKPLADICGKPMIWWVYQQAKKVPELNEVYVATDDKRIESVCKQYNMDVVMTSKDHPTGTDRVAEVAEKVNADYYVVCMGDEPLVSAEDISLMCNKIKSGKVKDAALLTRKFEDPVDVINTTTIKLVLNNNFELIFMSRMPLPYPKASLDVHYYKNIGVYSYKKDTLDFFRNKPVGKIEKVEDMELLRLIENHKIINTFEVNSLSFSVDTPKDLDRVREIMEQRLKKNI